MMNFKGYLQRTAAIAVLAATTLFFAAGSSFSLADSEMDCHSGIGMGGHNYGHGMGHGMHGMRPHNAAEHFLKMGPSLNLTDSQIKQITKLRDEYIEKNATAEEQLKVAYDDLARARQDGWSTMACLRTTIT